MPPNMSAGSTPPRVHLPDGFDEQRRFETPLRGYLSDVVVEMADGARYAVFFVDPTRLGQELEANVRLGEPRFAEPGLIVLPEVTVEAITEAVAALAQEGFFGHLRPIPEAREGGGPTT